MVEWLASCSLLCRCVLSKSPAHNCVHNEENNVENGAMAHCSEKDTSYHNLMDDSGNGPLLISTHHDSSNIPVPVCPLHSLAVC